MVAFLYPLLSLSEEHHSVGDHGVKWDLREWNILAREDVDAVELVWLAALHANREHLYPGHCLDLVDDGAHVLPVTGAEWLLCVYLKALQLCRHLELVISLLLLGGVSVNVLCVVGPVSLF